MSTVLLFPGQGSQRVGMGQALARTYPEAKQTFEEADDALGFSISSICFEGPEEQLTRTKYTQPAILTTSIAVYRVLRARRELVFTAAAGHSLGEFSALVAASALRFADAVRLVHLRGDAMQRAVPPEQGAMAAILGLELGTVRDVCRQVQKDGVCEPANLNGGGQIVISGDAELVERAIDLAKRQGAKRAVKLAVSAPFHCERMRPAAEELKQALERIEIAAPQVPVVANFDATPNSDPSRVKQLLVEQVTGAVRWEECVRAIVAMGITSGLELGTGAVVRGLVRRIDRALDVRSVGEPKDILALEEQSGVEG